MEQEVVVDGRAQQNMAEHDGREAEQRTVRLSGLCGVGGPGTTSRPAGRHPKEQVESGWRFLPCYMYTAPVIPLHQFTTAWWWCCHVRPHKAGGRYGIGGRLRCDSTRSQTRVSIFPALLTTPVRSVLFNNYYLQLLQQHYYNHYNNTTPIYEHLRHAEPLRPVPPSRGTRRHHNPDRPMLRNLVRQARRRTCIADVFAL